MFFEQGTCLSVYNKLKSPPLMGALQTNSILAGAVLSAVHEDKAVIKLGFSNGLELSVDRTFDGYFGPEAMHLKQTGFRWRAMTEWLIYEKIISK